MLVKVLDKLVSFSRYGQARLLHKLVGLAFDIVPVSKGFFNVLLVRYELVVVDLLVRNSFFDLDRHIVFGSIKIAI
jgi:hypothetical protein